MYVAAIICCKYTVTHIRTYVHNIFTHYTCTCAVRPALVVVKLTSEIMEAASGVMSGRGLRVVRNRRKSSL